MILRVTIQTILVAVLTYLLLSIHIPLTIKATSYGHVSSINTIPEVVYVVEPQAARFSFARPEPSGLTFVGDVLLARNVEFLMKQHGETYPYQGLSLTELGTSAHIVGNFEAAIPIDHRPTKTGEITFSVDAAFIPALRTAGFTHVSLANNHSYDYSGDGYKHTVEVLAEAGIAPFGHPRYFGRDSVTFLPVGEQTVALIGLHALYGAPTTALIRDTLAYAALQSAFQIVYVHWGTEYQEKSDTHQQKLAGELIAAGADLIIGHHPHVVQDIDLIDGVPVFYSLGNYIFDQYDARSTQESLVVHLDLRVSPTIKLLPVTSAPVWSQPTAMQPTAAGSFLHELAVRSHPELSDMILRGELLLDSLVATSPKTAMMNR